METWPTVTTQLPQSGPAAADWVLHVDLDQFIAAAEIGRRPELRGRPVVVGGSADPTQRRVVVATASYEARAFGVRSGMPLRVAVKRCPEAVFLASDPAYYGQVSAQVMAALRSFPVIVEVLGWDEAFVGVHAADPEAVARGLQRAVADATGLASSVGIGDTKLRAKIATSFGKPAGMFRLTRDNWLAVMGDRPPEALWGVGARTAAKLTEAGIGTVAALAEADPVALADRFGPRMGPYFRQLARGGGTDPVVAEPRIARSHSRESTFPEDLTARADLDAQLALLAEQVTADVRGEGRRVVRVGVKVRTASFFTRVHAMLLAAPTTDAADVYRAALTLLDRFELDRPVRLLGVQAEMDAPAAAGV